MKLYIYLMHRNTGKKAQMRSVVLGDNLELTREVDRVLQSGWN